MLPEIFEFQLWEHFRSARSVRAGGEPLVLVDGEDEVERFAGVPDFAQHRTEAEADRVEHLAFLPHFEPEVVLSHDAGDAHDLDVFREKDRPHVARAIRSELLQDAEKPRHKFLERYFAVDPEL